LDEWNADNTIKNRIVAIRQFFEWKDDVTIKYKYVDGDKIEIEETIPEKDEYTDIVNYCDYLDEIYIRTFHITDFSTNMMSEGYANRSVQDKCYCISNFADFIEERNYGDIDVNVGETRIDELEGNEIDEHTDKRYLKPDEIKDLISNARNLRDRVLLRLMADTGVRASEAISITIDQIDREERKIEDLVNAKQKAVSKEEETRDVYYTKRFSLLLDKWLNGGRDSYMYTGTEEDEGHLLVTKQSPRMEVQRVNEIFDETAERAGIQEYVYTDQSGRPRRKYTSHCLRHSFCVNRVKQGMPLIWLQQLCGHSDMEELKSYLKFKDEDKKKAYQKYKPQTRK
jgi:integrase/recombinase XerD